MADGTRSGEAFTFINVFEIDAEAIDTFTERWADRSRHMHAAEGFLGATLYRATTDDARFQMVNVAQWASADAFQAATADPTYRSELDQLFADLEGRLRTNPARYQVAAHVE